MSASQRNKGARGENEVVALIRTRWPRCHRNFASGASGGADITEGPPAVSWEVKRTERLRLRDAWRQANDAAGATDLPVLATRWNGGAWLAILELDELLALLELRDRP